MSNLYNPNGLVVMNQRGPDLGWLAEHSQRASYLTHTFLDMNRQAGEFQRKTGMAYMVSRLYPFEPHANVGESEANTKSGREKIKAYAHQRFDDIRNLRDDAQNGNVLFQINNEQGFRADDFLMYKYMIERSVELNDIIGMVFWNGASGSVKTGFWNEPNQWESWYALGFIKAMHRHRKRRLPNGAYAFVLGVHGYTSQYPLIAVNAGQWRKGGKNWGGEKGDKNLIARHERFEHDKALDWHLAQDHLGRNYQGIQTALGWQPSPDGKLYVVSEKILKDDDGKPVYCPWLLNTEQGFDNMNDVRAVHANELIHMAGFDTPQGFRSLEKTFKREDWYGPQVSTPGTVLAWSLNWQYRNIYARSGVHIGGHTFAAGDTSGSNFWWLSHNVWDTGRDGLQRDQGYFEVMESAIAKIAIASHFLRAPVTPPEPVPPPVDPPAPEPVPPSSWRDDLTPRFRKYLELAELFYTDSPEFTLIAYLASVLDERKSQ